MIVTFGKAQSLATSINLPALSRKLTSQGSLLPATAPCSSAAASLESDAYDAAAPVLLTKGKNMKYLLPPIVIPVLLFIGIAAHGILRPPIIVGHSAAPAANSQAR